MMQKKLQLPFEWRYMYSLHDAISQNWSMQPIIAEAHQIATSISAISLCEKSGQVLARTARLLAATTRPAGYAVAKCGIDVARC